MEAAKSQIYTKIDQLKDYANENQMKLNFKKTKFIVFNPTNICDFIPEYKIEDHDIETVEKIKLLGLVVRNDLRWKGNTKYMIERAYKRLWMVKRIKMK